MIRHPEPLRTGAFQTRTARIMEMIKLPIANGAKTSGRSHDGQDTEGGRLPQDAIALDTDNRPVDVAEIPGAGRVRQEGSEYVGQLTG